jgi:hypothetical protein
MRNWPALVIWAGVLLSGGVIATIGQDRWLIASGGVLVGVDLMAGVMLLVWSLVLRALCGSLRETLRTLRDVREGIGESRRNASPDRYSSPWRW